jgi:hypothetical protein
MASQPRRLYSSFINVFTKHTTRPYQGPIESSYLHPILILPSHVHTLVSKIVSVKISKLMFRNQNFIAKKKRDNLFTFLYAHVKSTVILYIEEKQWQLN